MKNPFSDPKHPIDYGLLGKDIEIKSYSVPKHNLADYIQIPGTDMLISKDEKYKGSTFKEAHFKLAKQGQFMPSPALFMPYFADVCKAFKGDIKLKDGNGRPLHFPELEQLFGHLTGIHNDGALSWLDAEFSIESARFHISTVTDVNEINKTPTLIKRKEQLSQRGIFGTAYFDLRFTQQGLPLERSATQEYVPGSNIYFIPPEHGSVVTFGVVDECMRMRCCSHPEIQAPKPGTFACMRKPN